MPGVRSNGLHDAEDAVRQQGHSRQLGQFDVQ